MASSETMGPDPPAIFSDAGFRMMAVSRVRSGSTRPAHRRTGTGRSVMTGLRVRAGSTGGADCRTEGVSTWPAAHITPYQVQGPGRSAIRCCPSRTRPLSSRRARRGRDTRVGDGVRASQREASFQFGSRLSNQSESSVVAAVGSCLSGQGEGGDRWPGSRLWAPDGPADRRSVAAA